MDLPRSLQARVATRRGAHVLAAALTLAFVAASPPARAAAPTAEEKAGARAAATEANAAYDAKRYADALDLFTRAESLVHAPTHLLMIARSQVALGQLVRGRETYNALVRETLAPNAPAVFKDAQVEGKKELEALEPRIPTIQVQVSGAAAPNLVVTMDGEPVPAALVGIARPVDPGTHVFRARGDGVSSAEMPVEVKEGERAAVTLELRADGTTPAAPLETGPTTEPLTGEEGSSDSTLTYLGFGGIGLGVVGIGVGAVFLGIGAGTRGDADEANDACLANPACTEGSPGADGVLELDGDANTQQTIGVVSLIAGGALAAAGVTMLLMAPSDEDTSRARITPWIGLGSAGVRGTY